MLYFCFITFIGEQSKCYHTKFKKDNALKNLSDDTLKYYDYGMKYFFTYLNRCHISKTKHLNADTIKDYIIELKKRGISAHSVNSYIRAVKRFVNFLISEGAIEHISVSEIHADETVKPTLSDFDLELIFNSQSQGQIFIIAALLLGTAIRANTLCNILVEDIDFNPNYLTLRKTKNHTIAQLPLTSPLATLIKEHIKHKRCKDFVFVNSKGGQYTRFTLWRALERYFSKIGVNKSGIHIFRRSFAKKYVKNGGDAFSLQKWLTHRSIYMAKKYVDLNADDLSGMIKYNPTVDLQVKNV